MDFMLFVIFMALIVVSFGLLAVRRRQLKLGLVLISVCSTMFALISGDLISLVAELSANQACENCFFISGGSRFLLDIGEAGFWLLSGACWLLTIVYLPFFTTETL
ncbi:hypothetical protein JWZ98_22955 (plasmid) [Methylomonas sp. EFPC1]|uniref:hypothetical protein n=1 Tax=Methylomonas sp. EFPC1 TaxID=2812647 RepID=UPI001968A112|nr:hypothetical protein [Methylomonas sp. EFPC1]QSB03773.1 hypothetical protein JWZ98_22955 [Methylomonas sp. EFPC1]